MLRHAADVGVPVPEVVAYGDGSDAMGAPYLVMNHIDGETIARRILRDHEYANARPIMARQCGEILANIHRMPLDSAEGLADDDPLERYANVYKLFGQPHPTFELAFKFLRERRPATTRRTIVHGDFRNGNLMVDERGLAGVLDWELAHLGDPMEDLGWLCINTWRFGCSDLPVGGFGTRDELFAGYEAAGGRVDAARVQWWEVLGTLKWGIVCEAMAQAWLGGQERDVEKAAIGRRASESEIDLLALLAPRRASDARPPLG